MTYEFTPFFYFLRILYLVCVIAALWMMFDSLRPVRAPAPAGGTGGLDTDKQEKARRKRKPIPVIPFTYFGAAVVILFLVNLILPFLTFIPADFRSIFNLISGFIPLIGFGVVATYLLKVVFPKPARPNMDETIPADAEHARQLMDDNGDDVSRDVGAEETEVQARTSAEDSSTDKSDGHEWYTCNGEEQ